MSASTAGRLLALDLPPGDRFRQVLDDVWQRGDAVLPLDPTAPPEAKRRTVAAMRPHAIVDDSGQTRYDDPAALDPDVALVITTSGSTDEPKGAQLSHAALEASAAATAARVGEAREDRWLSCLPWQHIGGIQVMLRARRASLPITVLPRFEVVTVAAAIAAGATLTSLVPTTLQRLLAAGVDLAPLKAILLGGAAASRGLLDAAAAANAPVITTYGMSETCGGCFYDGVALDGVRARIAVDGRIEIAGPTLMLGYRLRPDLDAETFTPDGWLRTNDLGSLEPDGRLTVIGRVDDVIVTGGEKVAAAPLADAIERHPDVVEAAVVGVDDPEWGQRVVAVIAARDDATLNLADLRSWLSDQVPSASLPRALLSVGELPRLATGKLDRLRLRELATAAPR